MCGIAGVLYADPARLPDREVLERMAATLAHRGPDATGVWAAEGVGLVHRRLSIIDLSHAADHPIANEDQSIRVVFNGEIYNYRELQAALARRGHVLRTHGDTETLVHLYEDEGAQFVERLRGMFAFGLWDSRRRRLLLARDRVGIKPLYVYQDAEKTIFGSEIKAILAHGNVDTSLDAEAIDDYLAYGFISAPRSIFRAIRKLMPGHTLTLGADDWAARPRRFWELRYAPEHGVSDHEWAERVRAKLSETVQAHLVSDVPVGAFLSGGIDSSVIVGQAAGLGGDMETFSIGFEEAAFSELPFAAEVARKFGTRHHEEIARPSATALLDDLVHHYDEPFADSSALPTFLVSRLAARSVKVVLSGDGGDEAFGGYPRYSQDARESSMRAWIPAGVRRSILPRVAAAWPTGEWLPRPLRASTALTNLSLDAGAAYANSLALCRLPLRHQLLQPFLLAQLGAEPAGEAVARVVRATGGEAASAMMAADLAVRVPDDYLTKVDRASMAFGLEVRPPFLDHELLELSARIPASVKIRGGRGKWILREACRDLLPASTQRPKRGFEIPIDTWMRGPLGPQVEDLVLSSHSPLVNYLCMDTVRTLHRRHGAHKVRAGNVLWSLLVLSRWLDRYLKADGPSPSHAGHPTRAAS